MRRKWKKSVQRWFLRFISVLPVLFVSALLPDPTAGATDPLAGNYDVYIKDSLLGLFLPFEGGTGLQTRFITFDAKSADVNVNNSDAKIVNGKSFTLKNNVNVTGLPAAMGRVRSEKGRLFFGIADYGGNGLFLHRGEIDLDGAIPGNPTVIFKGDNEGGDYRATDLVMYDVNGDGVEDYIIGEIRYEEKKKQTAYVRVIDGNSTETNSIGKRYKLEDLGGQTPFVKLDVGDFRGDGHKQLAVAFSYVKRGDAKGEYELRVFDFGLDLSLTEVYHQDISRFHEDTDALDLATGDFNGDGKDEIMVASDFYDSGNHKYHFKIFACNPQSFAWSSQYTHIDPATARNDYDGAVVSAFDLDRDGRDELVWIMPDSSGMFTLGLVRAGADNSLEVIWHEQNSVGYKEHSQPRHLSMVAGSFLGRNNLAAPNTRAGEVVVLRHDWDAGSDNMLTVFDVEGTGRNMKLVKRDGNGQWTQTNKCTPVLIAGNIKGESLRVSNADPIEETNVWALNSILQMPPKHVDYIPVPWNSDNIFTPPQNQQWGQLEGTAYEDFYGEISNARGVESANRLSQQVDWGLTGGIHLNINTRLQLDLAANAGGNFIENAMSERVQTVENYNSGVAEFQDQLSFSILTREVWRYEVTGEKYLSGDQYVPLWYDVAVPGESVATMMATGLDIPWYRPYHEPFNVLSYPSELRYTLDYGNSAPISGTFAYSSTSTATNSSTWNSAYMTENEVVNNVNFDASLTLGVALGDNSGKGVLKRLLGSKQNISREEAKFILEGTFGGHYFQETASTLSNAWSKETAIAYHLGNTVQQAKNKEKYTYNVSSQILRLPGGALMAANAVSLPAINPNGLNSTIWNYGDSVYSRLPDLALSLPRKFTTQGLPFENNFVEMIPQSEPMLALQMNGLRVLNPSGSEYPLTPGLLPRDCATPTLEIPIYNYSTGKEVSDFEVRLRMIPWDGSHFVFPDAADTPNPVFDRTYTVAQTIPPHKTGKDNRVLFRTPLDVSSFTPGNYMLFVELDPSNKIEEVHKNWDYAVPDPSGKEYFVINPEGDRGGNNIGYVSVAVADVLSEYPTTASAAAASLLPEGRLSASAEAVTLRMRVQESPDLSRSAIREAIKTKTDIPLTLELWYDEGPDFIPGFIVVAAITPDNGDAGEVVAAKSIPGMKKGQVYEFDASLKRLLLTAMAEKKGTLDFRILGTACTIDTGALLPPLPWSDGEAPPDPDTGSSSGGCSATGGLWLLLLAVPALYRRK